MALPYVRTAACIAPVTHTVSGQPRKAWVLHSGSVAIERLGAADMAVAARIVRFPSHGYARPRPIEEALSHDGGFWTAPEMQRMRIVEGRLDQLLDNPDAVAFLLYGDDPPWTRGVATVPLPKRLVDDGREQAEYSLRQAARDAILVDGVFHARRGLPSLAVVEGKLRTGRVVLSTDRWPAGYAFAPDRRAAVEAFLEVAVGPGGFSEVNVDIRDVEHGTGEALAFPEARANARHALVSALGAIKESLPSLDAAIVRHLAVLAGLREGIEAGDATPNEADAALLELDGMRTRMGVSVRLGHAIRIGRAAIALSRPELEPADRAALFSLAR